jgi:hypothetical protein
LGANTINLINFEGVSTAAHELGHSGGAGGQRFGDMDANGNVIETSDFQDTLMNNGAQNANEQTLKEILGFKGNLNIGRIE